MSGFNLASGVVVSVQAQYLLVFLLLFLTRFFVAVQRNFKEKIRTLTRDSVVNFFFIIIYFATRGNALFREFVGSNAIKQTQVYQQANRQVQFYIPEIQCPLNCKVYIRMKHKSSNYLRKSIIHCSHCTSLYMMVGKNEVD